MADHARVLQRPPCDLCGYPASFDARTVYGPWANLCVDHFALIGVGLGTGYGQTLVISPGGDRVRSEDVTHASDLR